MDTTEFAMIFLSTGMLCVLIFVFSKYREAKNTIDQKNKQEDSLKFQQQSKQFHEDIVGLRMDLYTLSSAVTDLNKSIVNSSLKDLFLNMKDLPPLVEGITLLIKAESDKVDSLNKAVDILEKSISPQGSEVYQDYAEDSESDDAREKKEIRNLIRSGIPANEAESRVRERRIYDSLARSR